MNYYIKNNIVLKKILWADTFLGGTTAVIGLACSAWLTPVLGLTTRLILVIAIITLLYAVVALVLAGQKSTSIPLLRILVMANWAWTVISTILLFLHASHATLLGVVFLVLQIVVVGALAWLEGNQIVAKTKAHNNVY